MILGNIVIFLLLISLLIILSIVILNNNECFSGSKTIESMNMNKKKPYMWVYWELVNGAKSPPPYVNTCLDIIKKNGSRFFNVVLLNEKNIFNYISDLRKDINDLPVALKTDYIRVKLLYLYGGLWVDADTILMTNLEDISKKLNDGIDFIGFGCTGAICKDQEGYGKPSNGVMGSVKNGKLITRCLNALNKKLDSYYSLSKEKRKEFNYFDLGKLIVWVEYDQLIKEEPSYKLYHIPSYLDGTRDENGIWIANLLIFKKNYKYSHRDKLLFVALANSFYCGNDPKYNWFCKLSHDEILSGDYFISELFRDAIKYDPYKN